MALVQLGRLPRQVDRGDGHHPRYVVWELTLACDQHCAHCGSRAGDARSDELDTEGALDVVLQLAAMGTQEVTLIGGEAYLHPGFLEVVAAIRDAGMRPSMTTGGRGITAELAAKMARAGLYGVSVSIDGVGVTHDLIRAQRGGYEVALQAILHLRAAGIRVGCNTVVNRLNLGELEALYEVLRKTGIEGWQVQQMAALGRAADRPDLLLQPWDLLGLLPRLAALKTRAFGDRILLTPGNNVGYFSPDEKHLRSLRPDEQAHFGGCQAGRYVAGIEADGAVKGCPSLQTDHYVGGRVRERSIRAIWDESPELAFTRARGVDDLWGYCRECPFAEHCLAGCTFTAHALLGRPGNNPMCHFRAKTFAARGLRERLVARERAPGKPFDNGRFEIVLEPFDAPDPKPQRREQLLQIRRPAVIDTTA